MSIRSGDRDAAPLRPGALQCEPLDGSEPFTVDPSECKRFPAYTPSPGTDSAPLVYYLTAEGRWICHDGQGGYRRRDGALVAERVYEVEPVDAAYGLWRWRGGELSPELEPWRSWASDEGHMAWHRKQAIEKNHPSLGIPPTCAFRVHWLHRRVSELIERAERYASALPGLPTNDLELWLWSDLEGVRRALNIPVWDPLERSSFPDLSVAERWLRNLLSDFPGRVATLGPDPERTEHARRLASPDYLQAFRAVLVMIPDPFDGPRGEAVALCEQARWHFNADPMDFDFDADIPPDYWREYRDAFIDPISEQGRPDALERFRLLLIKYGLLRERRSAPGVVPPSGPPQVKARDDRQGGPATECPALPAPGTGASRADKPEGENVHEATSAPSARTHKVPSERAIQCYRLSIIRGDVLDQRSIARQVYGAATKQYQVSRDLKAVKAWIEAGNILPDLEARRPTTTTMDPRKLEQGPRRDGRRP